MDVDVVEAQPLDCLLRHMMTTRHLIALCLVVAEYNVVVNDDVVVVC